MPVPSTINDLSTTPGSNGPVGSTESPASLDDYLRAHAAFIAQLRDETQPVARGGTGATTAADARTALDVPSRTGSGASGAWAISISGNAATVTNGVYTTGNQTISGEKSFSDTVYFGGGGWRFTPDSSRDTGMYWDGEGQVNVICNGAFAGKFVSSGWDGPVPTARVLTATAGASAGAVGTYAMLFSRSVNLTAGQTVAGSNLRAQGLGRAADNVLTTGDSTGPAQSGTWLSLTTQSAGSFGCIGFFLRIS